MRSRTIAIAVGAVLLVAVAGGGVAWATVGRSDDDTPLTGATLAKATAAALEHTGGGTVTGSEVGDDGAAYSVEIRLESGRSVEVSLDEQFHVLGQEADDDTSGESDESSGD